MIRCPVCRDWFDDMDNVGMEEHLEKKHYIRITINKMSYEDISRKIETHKRKHG